MGPRDQREGLRGLVSGGIEEPGVGPRGTGTSQANPPANAKCPRCGFYVGNVFACAVCRDRRVMFGGSEPEG